MDCVNTLKPERVFHYFEEISRIPRGSGDMVRIADYCVDFANKTELSYVRDEADNVIIYKPASVGYESSEPVILQGHLDMVCQKTEESEKDFSKDGIDLVVDGDFLKADDTTLGGDNGIAVAMVMAILEDNSLSHPAIEAVFTTDEEIGMVGALQLDMSFLKGKKMINLDSEEDDTATVSCAGGSDFEVTIPVKKVKMTGKRVTVIFKGLLGGHSGVEIHKGRANADILAGRFLNKTKCLGYGIISINGGDKSNAIPNSCRIELCVKDVGEFEKTATPVIEEIKKEISDREALVCELSAGDMDEYQVIDSEAAKNLVFSLVCIPDGVMSMSADIPGLVETSLNLGVLKTEEDKITLHSALRSNKMSALMNLEDKLKVLFESFDCGIKTYGHYPAWEYNSNSSLQNLYTETYKEMFEKEPDVAAIHAGLECGVFAGAINDFDCIAIGPNLFDVHIVNERLDIKSTENIYNLLVKMLEKLH